MTPSICLPHHKALIGSPLPAEVFELVGFSWNDFGDLLEGFEFFPDDAQQIIHAHVIAGRDFPSCQNAARLDNSLVGFFRGHGGNRAAGENNRQVTRRRG